MQFLKDIIGILSTVFGIFAAFVGMLSVAFGVVTYFRDSRRKTCTETMAEYKKLQDEVLSKLNGWRRDQIEDAVETADSVGYEELNVCLAKIEHFCVGINRGVYDFETFYQLAHGYFDSGDGLMDKLEPLLRDKIGFAEEDYYNNLHKVWARMKERSKRPL
ncbi:MAG: hypothetical protein K6F68_04440 [Clostridiales bacterium]|nr:hypothetical protein [Clostridiales bacterium]